MTIPQPLVDEVDYKNGPKNNWRRSLWNAIKDRLAVPAKDAVVLYLAGAADLDRTVALQKGFRSQNLIAIDRSAEKIRRLRSRGAIAIEGEFFDVVYSWRKSIDVVYGDFCSGMERSLLSHMMMLGLLPQVRQSVLAFNVMRGRDKSTNDVRAAWNQERGLELKHRGLIAATEFIAWCFGVAHNIVELKDGELRYVDLTPEEERVVGENFHKFKYGIVKHSMPLTLDYQSTSGQVFDSFVMVHPLRGASCGSWVQRDEALKCICGTDATRRKVAAAMAVRTIRQ